MTTRGPSTTADRAATATGERLDVGFVPAECPGQGSAGATRTSELLIERLSQYHDLTVYVASQTVADPATLPARERVDYVLNDGLAPLPHPLWTKLDALRDEADAMASHDLVHSYSPGYIPVLADLPVPTVATLNSYLPACPKGDMRYHDGRKCSGPSTAKCVNCIAHANLDRRQGVSDSLRAAYSSLGKLGFVDDALEAAATDIDGFQALTPHIKDDYADLGVPADRIDVIPHFYDESFHEPTGERSVDRDEPTLLYVGRLKDNKGPQILVRAIPLLRESGYDVTVRIAGTGPHADDLQRLARDLGVDDAIEWLGYVDHDRLPAHYDAADVFVFPGLLDEPFGRVMLEALGTGTPVLASDVGSTDYIVGDGGVIVEPGNPSALVAGCESLLEEYERHRRAIPAQLERFEPATVESAFCDLYARVAEGRSRRVTSP